MIPGGEDRMFYLGQLVTCKSDFIEDRGDDGMVMGEEPYFEES